MSQAASASNEAASQAKGLTEFHNLIEGLGKSGQLTAKHTQSREALYFATQNVASYCSKWVEDLSIFQIVLTRQQMAAHFNHSEELVYF